MDVERYVKSYGENDDDAPCVVVGSSLAALHWAVTLQRSTYTVLLTPSEYATDPYLPAASAAGHSTDDLIIRPEEVLDPGTVLYGELLDQRDSEIYISLREGQSFWLPMRVLLHGDSPGCEVNGISWDPRAWGPGAASGSGTVDGAVAALHSDHVTLTGHPGSAASTAVELLTGGYTHSNEPTPEVTWNVGLDDNVSARWIHVVTALGGNVCVGVAARRRDFVTAASRSSGSPGPSRHSGPSMSSRPATSSRTADEFGREDDRERSFRLADHELSPPNGGLYENISTCAFSTGTFPLKLRRLRKSTVYSEAPVVLSRRAKTVLIKRGIARSALSAGSLDRRVETIRETIRVMRG
ncbi:MAG: hypothetical protein WCY01_12760 [Alkalispirochaeta sp.]